MSKSVCAVPMCAVCVCGASMAAAVGEMLSVPIMRTTTMCDNFCPSRQCVSFLLLEQNRRANLLDPIGLDAALMDLLDYCRRLLPPGMERQLTGLWPESSSLSYGERIERTIFITTDST